MAHLNKLLFRKGSFKAIVSIDKIIDKNVQTSSKYLYLCYKDELLQSLEQHNGE